MSSRNIFPVKAFFSRTIFVIGVTSLFFLNFSCDSEVVQPLRTAPELWEGNESSLIKGFMSHSEANDSVLVFKESGLPYSGAIERNSSVVSTRQSFVGGPLTGTSTKRSKDGSWVDASYKDGRLHGKMIFYSPSGKIRSVMYFEEGELVAQPLVPR